MRGECVAVGLAVSEATRSEHSFKHGAAVFKNGKIIQSGRNQFCDMNRIRHFKSHRIWSINAEMNALGGLPKHMTRGASIAVVRVTKAGDLSCSKPCVICMTLIKSAGIKNLIYSTGINTMKTVKIDYRSVSGGSSPSRSLSMAPS
jgi:tRNA(Arg) A34 adenosine deaminase TadA